MNTVNISKIAGAIAVVCGIIVLVGAISTGKISDWLISIFLIAIGLYGIFKNKFIKPKQ